MEPTLFSQTRKVIAILLFSAAISFSQEATVGKSTFFSSKGMDDKSLPDTNIVFESPNKDIITPQQTASLVDAGGIDVLLSTSGFGLGGFYRHQYTEEVFGTLSIGFSEVNDPNEVEEEDIYGQTYVPGKINRFLLIPLLAGVGPGFLPTKSLIISVRMSTQPSGRRWCSQRRMTESSSAA